MKQGHAFPRFCGVVLPSKTEHVQEDAGVLAMGGG